MIVEQMLMAAAGNSGDPFNAVKLDGTNDYLTRGADLTGIVDGKSGIFSCWVRLDGFDATLETLFSSLLSLARFGLTRTASNKFRFLGKNAAGTTILDQATTATYQASAKAVHVLASWDLNTTTFQLYINDVADVTSTTKTNDTIDYATTTPNWSVGSETDGTNKLDGCLAELYFAPNQYLDFSVTANRRLFITAEGRPQGLGQTGSLPTGTAPAIYLKGDKTGFGINSGTGGDFTVTGALERASTTPNTVPAWNAVKYDGTSDYLTRGADLTGVVDGTQGIVSFWIRVDGGAGATGIIITNVSNTVYIAKYSDNKIRVQFTNAAATVVADLTTAATFLASPAWVHVMASWDCGAAASNLYIDGVSDKVVLTTPTGTIDYATTTPDWGVGASTAAGLKFTGAIAELYFAPNQYLDLSQASNRAKFYNNGAPVNLGFDGSTPTGTAPIVYLPNRAALVGTNAGTGGNFTINGAPKDANSTPVYYYAEPSTFDGTNDYLTRGADLTGIADGKAGTFSCWLRVDGGAAALQRILANLTTTLHFHVARDASNKFVVTGLNAAGTTILLLTSTTAYSTSAIWVHVLASWDLAAAAGHMYINNVSDLAGGSTLTNDTIDYVTATPNWAIGADTGGTNKLFSTIADLWFNTTYLDISQASNRAKFIDQTTLRPVPLGAKGELPTGSQPLLYLGRDYANFQTNLGSGGAFTVTGALTRGTTSASDVRS